MAHPLPRRLGSLRRRWLCTAHCPPPPCQPAPVLRKLPQEGLCSGAKFLVIFLPIIYSNSCHVLVAAAGLRYSLPFLLLPHCPELRTRTSSLLLFLLGPAPLGRLHHRPKGACVSSNYEPPNRASVRCGSHGAGGVGGRGEQAVVIEFLAVLSTLSNPCLDGSGNCNLECDCAP